ncbi:hypothetical protein MCOR27_008592 [Pyricularia oryzae]|uniref:Serine hydrolase domain-containing protein n=3 Tax=Pyricularia TaxID=48558 RepID=A0ABQ8NMJ7_PYRGI|nr:uncharacterized protein MGG_04173 [Pyricularia oryzae 70-15]KAH8845786.1 hypothetical protein MCOR01_003016 [Pyricularia oryzae]KAI6299375.1 hypothetical protein MCOR33_004704 [Pyricularia grisea]EHA47285.1 hypothetical protein MGG_04173 [Pyricularia oryzae 70-15]KAH9432709.1 hypothetical protein MCOR02_007392 [Pyricularia oryzae]KAI6258474.1 hypothetical protein MCOR19_005126 [Pyricularia oryzae]
MRVLCLHGFGTSGAILKSQTVAFRNKLDSSYSFDFVDAPFRCGAAPGVDALWLSSGNFTWWPQATPQAIRAAHLWLDDYLADNGPYDAILCFSQGCALVGSYLLYHARETPDAPLPFKSVIFICGGMPFDALEDLGIRVSQRAHDINDRTSKALKAKAAELQNLAKNPDKIVPGVGLWDNTLDLCHDPRKMPNPTDVFGLDFTTFPQDLRITIPTVHIYGGKDPKWPSSMQLAYFCNNRKMYDHQGGHDVPRSTEVSLRIAQLVRDVIAQTVQED